MQHSGIRARPFGDDHPEEFRPPPARDAGRVPPSDASDPALECRVLGFQQSGVATAVLDKADILLAANRAFCELTGQAEDQLLGKSCGEVLQPGARALPGADMPAGPEAVAFEQRFACPDGRVRWGQVTLTPVDGPDGRAYRLVQVQDVTPQRRADADTARQTHALLAVIRAQRAVTAAAQNSDAVLQVMAQQAVEAFPAADGAAVEMVDGNVLHYAAVAGLLAPHRGVRLTIDGSLSGIAMATGTTVSCEDTETDDRVNREACRRVGIRSMCIAPLFSADKPIGVLKVAAAGAHAFRTDDTHQLELLASSLSAALRHAEAYAQNSTLLAERTAALAARDRAAAELAERNRELTAANHLKQDLIGMLGHEIGSPLAAIRVYADMLIETWDEAEDLRRLRDVQTIDRNARRLELIVHDVLALVTADAGRLTAHPQDIVLHTHLRAIVSHAAGTPASIVCPSDLTVAVDPRHLQQIIVNLLSNAAKYGAGTTRITAGRAGNRILIRVSDDGPGVSEPFRSQLFERFARSDSTSATVPGTGLGLYIVRELARANGGDITYEATAGAGATFAVSLPAAKRRPR